MNILASGSQKRTPFSPKEPRRRSGGPWLVLAVVVAAVVGVLLIGSVIAGLIFQPFKTVEVDRTPPPVLVALKDLATYEAASGEYEVLVDTEKDVKYVPSWIAGERTLFIGVGTVDAVVDFRNLGEANIETSPDRRSVTIHLPPSTLESAVVDPARSHVADRDRGILDRIGGAFEDEPTSEKALYEAAAAKMNEAALASDLQLRAQENTTIMLTRLLQGVGYENVTIVFDGEPVSGPVVITPNSPSPTA